MNKNLLKLQNEFLDLYCRFYPVTATSLGLKKGLEDFQSYSSQEIASYLQNLKKMEAQLASFRISKLSVHDQIDLELLQKKILLEKNDLQKLKTFEKDPGVYLGEVLYGIWYLLIRPFSKVEKKKALLERIRKIPEHFKSAEKNLIQMSPLWVVIALQECGSLVSFLKDCEKQWQNVYGTQKKIFKKYCKEAGLAALRFENFLKAQLKKSKTSFAVGPKNFQFLLKNYHGFSESSQQLLKIGQQAFVRTQKELQDLAKKSFEVTRWEKAVDVVKQDHPASNHLIKTYQKEVERLKSFIRKKDLVTLPSKESLKVIETPLFSRSTIPYAAYIDPPLFHSDRTGHFFVTPIPKNKESQHLLKEHAHASLVVTALHEGYPGHHLQFVHQANQTRPIRKIFNASSYYEGWALYCEEMMHEAGYYSNDSRLLQLKDRLWRACRVIVDIQMQTQKMSDVAAVNFLSKNARMAKASARGDVNWYTQRPTVPMSYLIGMMKIQQLREKAKIKWGRLFSLKRFHDWFLSFGAIPLSIIERAL
ncbi:MAG: DUF885 domain-containing protein [Deltaproteobacteria bacterium]|nr:DUF885 domain-containing protein [Deltaproteobacteria bacterium]